MLLGSIIALALIAGFLYFIRHKSDRRSSHKSHKQHKTHKSDNQGKKTKHSSFHCVETHHHANCCKAVKDLHGKRFLSSEAPTLPVEGCTQAHCECDYIHHEDRRVEVRRTDMGIQHDMYGQNGETEHRNKSRHGRRATH